MGIVAVGRMYASGRQGGPGAIRGLTFCALADIEGVVVPEHVRDFVVQPQRSGPPAYAEACLSHGVSGLQRYSRRSVGKRLWGNCSRHQIIPPVPEFRPNCTRISQRVIMQGIKYGFQTD